MKKYLLTKNINKIWKSITEELKIIKIKFKKLKILKTIIQKNSIIFINKMIKIKTTALN